MLILANESTGLYKFRKELLETLRSRGNQIEISVPDGGFVRELEEMGCRVMRNRYLERRSMNPFSDFRLLLSYFFEIKRNRPALVITYTVKPNIYGGIACRLTGTPYIANVTGLGSALYSRRLLEQIVVFLYQISLKNAKAVFFENKENAIFFRDNNICRSKQIRLLHGAGVNLTEYAYTGLPERQGARKAHFLFIGRIMREKGIDELLAACERLKKEGLPFGLDIVGPCEEEYADRIRNAEREGWLRYHGFVRDVRQYIRNCDCGVLPSWHEGMANANLECAAMGRAVITSDIPGCREAVADSVSGFLCRVRDGNSLYDGMKRFMDLPFEEKRAMGKAGRKRMERYFDRQKVVSQTIDAIEF